jgi:hypothetical protein
VADEKQPLKAETRKFMLDGIDIRRTFLSSIGKTIRKDRPEPETRRTV